MTKARKATSSPRKATSSRSSSTSKTAKLGDEIKIDGPGAFVRLPSGEVTTARSSYIARHVGEHEITPSGGKPYTVTVTDD